jgi:hypothetical protein
LATYDHFSSNWTSVVRGGKGDQLVVGLLGVVSGLADIASHRIAMDPHQPLGLADAAAVGDVLQDGDGLLLGQVRAEQGRALAFGEPDTARTASEEPDRRGGLAVVTGDGEVFAPSDAMIGALGIQAAEHGEVTHGPPPTTYLAMRASSCDCSSE